MRSYTCPWEMVSYTAIGQARGHVAEDTDAPPVASRCLHKSYENNVVYDVLVGSSSLTSLVEACKMRALTRLAKPNMLYAPKKDTCLFKAKNGAALTLG